jgi:hypothetical protein
VVTLDRRKLTALLLAQAAAFVVVLVIGALAGHKSPPHPVIPVVSHTSAPRITSTHSTRLTVKVSLLGGTGVTTPSVPVEILKDHTISPVMAAQLTQGAPADLVVPAGDYQVCVMPPTGWVPTGHNTGALPGWDCTKVDARSLAQTVTFHLTFQPTNTGTVPL